MSRTLSLAMLVAAFSQETGEAILPLLTVTHPDWDDGTVLRAVLNGEDIVSRGNTFVAFPFDLVVPDDSPDRPPQATITFDNIDRRLVAALESTLLPPQVSIEIVRGSSPDTVEVGWYGLSLREIKYNQYTVSGVLTYESLQQETYPVGTFSPAYFPGLF